MQQAAIDRFERAITIWESCQDDAASVDTLTRLGNFLYSQSSFLKAADIYHRSLELSRKIQDKQRESYALTNLGNVYYLLGQYQKANDLHQQSIEISIEIGDDKFEISKRKFDREFLQITKPAKLRYLIAQEILRYDMQGKYEANEILHEVYVRGLKLLEIGKEINTPDAWLRTTARKVIQERHQMETHRKQSRRWQTTHKPKK
jgi:tetratricopeptide (TPR) repeat protein